MVCMLDNGSWTKCHIKRKRYLWVWACVTIQTYLRILFILICIANAFRTKSNTNNKTNNWLTIFDPRSEAATATAKRILSPGPRSQSRPAVAALWTAPDTSVFHVGSQPRHLLLPPVDSFCTASSLVWLFKWTRSASLVFLFAIFFFRRLLLPRFPLPLPPLSFCGVCISRNRLWLPHNKLAPVVCVCVRLFLYVCVCVCSCLMRSLRPLSTHQIHVMLLHCTHTHSHSLSHWLTLFYYWVSVLLPPPHKFSQWIFMVYLKCISKVKKTVKNLSNNLKTFV